MGHAFTRRSFGITALGAAALALLPFQALAQSQPDGVITLGSSVTEIAYAIGAGDQLIARDTTSVYPEAALALPDIGYVRALSPEGVISLGPKVILADPTAGPPDAIEVLKNSGITYVTIPDDMSHDGVLAKITAVGAALGHAEAAAQLAEKVGADLTEAEQRAAAVTDRKRVLFLLANQGGRLMAGGDGSSAEAIIRLAGGENAVTGFQGYKQISDEAALTAAPDLILMIERSDPLAVKDSDILGHPALRDSPAAQHGALVRMDGNLLLGFGPRVGEAAKQLNALLYSGAQ